MNPPQIKAVSRSARKHVIRTITLGFLADPVARWIWPDADRYLELMPRFVAAFGGKAFDHGSAYVADRGRAAALWLPPGVDPDGEAVAALLNPSVSEDIADDVDAVFVQMDDFHPTDRPYWYLPMIAADPAYQGRGLGAAILKHTLQRCDQEGVMPISRTPTPATCRSTSAMIRDHWRDSSGLIPNSASNGSRTKSLARRPAPSAGVVDPT